MTVVRNYRSWIVNLSSPTTRQLLYNKFYFLEIYITFVLRTLASGLKLYIP